MMSLCTEGLGFESSDDVGGCKKDGEDRRRRDEESSPAVRKTTTRGSKGEFPPPITCIGRNGISFESYRENGRFILKEMKIPAQEFLQAHRENGRLTLKFVQYDDDDDDDQQRII
ncbi:hypothetical protein M569_09597 [Genlisea aurea]|uniref:FAF domain-containing protein n=1 Tax=Genlisea aurea TaxID=192259 RepID=S8DYR6_9LAMI|nr:hypothetical protein M569_09597 [Genlisea aurea]